MEESVFTDIFFSLIEECRQKKDKPSMLFLDRFHDLCDKLRPSKRSIDDFEKVQTIGKGGFSVVYLAKDKKNDNRVVALKVLSKWEMLRREEAACFQSERDCLVKAKMKQNNWVIELYECFQDEDFLYLATEFYPGGDLLGFIQRSDENELTEDIARYYLAEIIVAIESLNNLGFAHRDIKPDNILIAADGHIRLADFGSCIEIPSSGEILTKTAVGTPDYLPFEILQSIEKNTAYGKSCDLWSLGIILYEMLCGETPFFEESLMKTYSRITKIAFTFPEDIMISETTKDLIRKLITHPKQRLTIPEIKSHPFFESISWPEVGKTKPPFVPNLKNQLDTSNFDPIEDEDETPIKTPRPKGFSWVSLQLPFMGYSFVGSRSSKEPIVENTEKMTQMESTVDKLQQEIFRQKFQYVVIKNIPLTHESKEIKKMNSLKRRTDEKVSVLEVENETLKNANSDLRKRLEEVSIARTNESTKHMKPETHVAITQTDIESGSKEILQLKTNIAEMTMISQIVESPKSPKSSPLFVNIGKVIRAKTRASPKSQNRRQRDIMISPSSFSEHESNLPLSHQLAAKTFDIPTTCVVCSKLMFGTVHQGVQCPNCAAECHENCAKSLNPECQAIVDGVSKARKDSSNNILTITLTKENQKFDTVKKVVSGSVLMEGALKIAKLPNTTKSKYWIVVQCPIMLFYPYVGNLISKAVEFIFDLVEVSYRTEGVSFYLKQDHEIMCTCSSESEISQWNWTILSTKKHYQLNPYVPNISIMPKDSIYLPHKAEIMCHCFQGSTIHLGTSEGIYSFSNDESTRISEIKKIVAIEYSTERRTLFFLGGKTKYIYQLNNGKETRIDETKNCQCFCLTGSNSSYGIVCALPKKKILLFSESMIIKEEITCPDLVYSLTYHQKKLFIGFPQTVRIYSIDKSTHVDIPQFHIPSYVSDNPVVQIFELDEKEILMCFHVGGFFCDHQGNSTRGYRLQWSGHITKIEMNAVEKKLLVYYSSYIEIHSLTNGQIVDTKSCYGIRSINNSTIITDSMLLYNVNVVPTAEYLIPPLENLLVKAPSDLHLSSVFRVSRMNRSENALNRK